MIFPPLNSLFCVVLSPCNIRLRKFMVNDTQWPRLKNINHFPQVSFKLPQRRYSIGDTLPQKTSHNALINSAFSWKELGFNTRQTSQDALWSNKFPWADG
eukprot:c10482_g2_i1 orf=420-719(+)